MSYERRFAFPPRPGEVWSTISRVDRVEEWRGWLTDLHVEGTPLETGWVLEGVVTPPLPYRMHLRVALLECIAPTRINAEIPGDLVGRGRVLLEPHGDATPATIGWTFEMMQTPMRVAARVAPPLLRWGHDGVVDVTVATFRRHLDGNAAI
jgi:hypothetical protein